MVIAALRFAYTRLRSLRPSVSRPPAPFFSVAKPRVVIFAALVEKTRAAARVAPSERRNILLKPWTAFVTAFQPFRVWVGIHF